MSQNPFLSQWLSAANSATGAARGFWTAEFARQQGAMISEFNRQAIQFWTGAWAAGMARATSAAKPAQVDRPVAQAAEPPAPIPVPDLAALVEALPLPTAPAVPATLPAEVTEAKPAKPARKTLQLRATTAIRKGAKPVASKAGASKAGARGRHTRH